MVAEKKISTSACDIFVDERGILILELKEGAELDLAQAKAAFAAYSELGVAPHNKILQLIRTSSFVNMSPDARKFAASQGKNFFKASAIVGSSLAIRLVVNFFNQFYKHDVPFKLFDTEEKARKWLEKFR